MRALVTGATGFVGGRLVPRLIEKGFDVRAVVRNPDNAEHLDDLGCELWPADVTDAQTLRHAGRGIDVAYYLVHSMGRGAHGDFAARELQSAENFARMATDDGVARVIYLGGLADSLASEHLRSRHKTARVLDEQGPPLTYFRAGMVVGPESESFKTLKFLVERLPAMIAPSWLKNLTQPIDIDDVVEYLARAVEVEESTGREFQIGGPDVLSYGEMLDVMAEELGTFKRPRVPVPLLTPWLSSLWIGLVTPVDAGVARPLIEGLSTSTVVRDDAARELFGIEPIDFRSAIRKALAES